MIVLDAEGFFVDTTFDIPNVDPHYEAIRWWKEIFRASRDQIIVACDSPDARLVEAWLRANDANHSYALSIGGGEDDAIERLKKLVSHAGSLHSKIDMYVSTSLADCNWMSSLGSTAIHWIHPRPVNERFEEDNRSSWQKVSAGIVEVVEIS